MAVGDTEKSGFWSKVKKYALPATLITTGVVAAVKGNNPPRPNPNPVNTAGVTGEPRPMTLDEIAVQKGIDAEKARQEQAKSDFTNRTGSFGGAPTETGPLAPKASNQDQVKKDFEERNAGPNYHGATSKTGPLAQNAPTPAKPPVGAK